MENSFPLDLSTATLRDLPRVVCLPLKTSVQVPASSFLVFRLDFLGLTLRGKNWFLKVRGIEPVRTHDQFDY